MCILKIDFMLWVLVEFKIKKLSDEFQICFLKKYLFSCIDFGGRGQSNDFFTYNTRLIF